MGDKHGRKLLYSREQGTPQGTACRHQPPEKKAMPSSTAMLKAKAKSEIRRRIDREMEMDAVEAGRKGWITTAAKRRRHRTCSSTTYIFDDDIDHNHNFHYIDEEYFFDDDDYFHDVDYFFLPRLSYLSRATPRTGVQFSK